MTRQIKSVYLLVAIGGLLRCLLAVFSQHIPSHELATIQGDNFWGASSYFLEHGDIPDPVFVPGYIYLCSLCRLLLPNHALFLLVLIQCVLGTACIPLARSLGAMLYGERCAAILALLVTFNPLLIIQSSFVLTEAVYIPLLLATVYFFVSALVAKHTVHASVVRFALCGILLGLSTLTRSVGLLVAPVMVITLLCYRQRSLSLRFLAAIAVCLPVGLCVLPLCLHNQAKYQHFNISSSGKFNIAALVVGPTKKAFDHVTNPELLAMWRNEVGPARHEQNPFDLANTAASVAMRWAGQHPARTVGGIAKGQLLMLVAPDRSSWAAELAMFRLSGPTLKVFYSAIGLYRLIISICAIAGLVYFRRYRTVDLLPFIAGLILTHMAGAGASGLGRFVAPVSPYLDLLASITMVSLFCRPMVTFPLQP